MLPKKRTSLIYTLPYDKGWFAKQNGKAIKISKAQNGLMKIDVSKGSGKIIMTLCPQGLYQGIPSYLSRYLSLCIFTNFITKI